MSNRNSALIGCGIYLALSVTALFVSHAWPRVLLVVVVSLAGIYSVIQQMPTKDEPKPNPRIEVDKENLTVLIDNHDALLEENERLKKLVAEQGITLPGWWCTECDIFNGEMHSKHQNCRKCEKPKPKPQS